MIEGKTRAQAALTGVTARWTVRRTVQWMALYAVVIVVALARVAVTVHTFSPVVDEPVHIAAGYEWWRGNVSFDPPHPPLARLLAAWPLRNVPPPVTTDLNGRGHAILDDGGDLMPHLARARMGNLFFLALALVCTIMWGLRYGRGVALLAAAMLASLPPILGHTGVATTDMAVAATLPLALLAFDRWLRERTYANALLAGGAIGLGALSKFSFAVFFPVSVLALLIARRPRLEAKRTAIGMALAACTAFLLIWAGYRFTFGTSDTWPNLPMPAPAFLHGLTIVQRHNALGHDSYLFGAMHHFGWWYYFPVVFFFKTPLPFLLLAAIGAAVIATRRHEALDLVLIPVAMMLSVLPSTINIGIRHILPIYPPLCVMAAIGAAALWKLGNRDRQLTTDNRQRTSTPATATLYLSGARAVAVATGIWLFGGVALAHPDYLAWFNEAAGRHPERIAVDSNLDWGQDALRLRRFVRRQHLPEIFLFCYDTVPIDHGINLPPGRKAHGWVAVGETPIHIDPYARAGAYDWLREYEPVGRIGTSIRLYHIP